MNLPLLARPLTSLFEFRNANIYRKRGLEFKRSRLPFKSTNQLVWNSSPIGHCQVISPGRSGTRWLANVLIEASQAFVFHATPKTLAEPGYLLDRGLISEDEALGAYRYSRADFLFLAEQSGSIYIDLDCKVSPFARVIADFYNSCRFLILLRNPISFIRSGIARGYFGVKNPRAWGHLESFEVSSSLPPEEWQIYKIAAFWRSIALLSDSMLNLYSGRVYVMNTRVMFTESSELARFLNWLDLDHGNLSSCKSFHRIVNANRPIKLLTPVQQAVLSSNFLVDYCFDSLSSQLIEKCGFSDDFGAFSL